MIFPLLFAGVLLGAASPETAAAPSAPPASTLTVAAGTTIPVHLSTVLSSHDAHTGQTFTFYVDKDVVVDGTVLIPRCASGSGTVTRVICVCDSTA